MRPGETTNLTKGPYVRLSVTDQDVQAEFHVDLLQQGEIGNF